MTSSTRAEYHPQAAAELETAVRWYALEDRSLARAFRDAAAKAEADVLEAPGRWPQYQHGTRRYLLRHFPFALVYAIEADGTVYVVALAHHKRRPGYWAERLPSP